VCTGKVTRTLFVLSKNPEESIWFYHEAIRPFGIFCGTVKEVARCLGPRDSFGFFHRNYKLTLVQSVQDPESKVNLPHGIDFRGGFVHVAESCTRKIDIPSQELHL